MPIVPGQLVADRYRFARRLGEGAMGEVWEAENELIHRRVAIKVLHPHVAEKLEAVRRFEREAQAAGRIGSPHIVEVLDLGVMDDGARFLVMELLEGMTLAQRIRVEGRLSPVHAAEIGCQILQGIAAAHAVEIVHRDLKPANIFLAERVGPHPEADFVKILDFGVSKFSFGEASAVDDGSRPHAEPRLPLPGEDLAMTALGSVLGTPQYMSPEQAKGTSPIDARSDLYAVGVLLYECVSGQLPFEAKTVNELIFRIVLEAPPPLESLVPELDPVFAGIVKKAMAREPAHRYQTALDLHAALSRWLSPARIGLDSTGVQLFPSRAPRSKGRSGERTLVAGLLAALGIGAITLFATRPHAPDLETPPRPAASASPPSIDPAPPVTMGDPAVQPITAATGSAPTPAPSATVRDTPARSVTANAAPTTATASANALPSSTRAQRPSASPRKTAETSAPPAKRSVPLDL